MSGTSRTWAALNTTWADSGANGRLTPATMRDVIATMRANSPTISVWQYGAFGDAAAHPASSVYGSLGALQAVYGTTKGGVTIALTNELDWLGIQAAVEFANAGAQAGGSVYIPDGRYILSNSNSPGDGSGTVLLPEATWYWVNGFSTINLYGAGTDVTILVWPTDLGTGKFGLLDNLRKTTVNGNAGTVGRITLEGPAGVYLQAHIGTAQASMSGYGIGDSKHLEDFCAVGFRAGVDVVGGQRTFSRLNLDNNFYNLYWSDPNPNLFDDNIMYRIRADLTLRAAVGIHHNATIGNTNWIKCFLGTSPFGFFKETNAGVPGKADGLFCNHFDKCQWENIGNALYADDRTTVAGTATAACSSLYGCDFQDLEFLWGIANYNDAAYVQAAVFCCISMDGCTVSGDLGQLSPGTQGVFSVTSNATAGLVLRGNVNAMLAACVSAGGARNNLFANNEQMSARLYNTFSFQWEGVACCGLTTSVVATNVVNLSAYQFPFITVNAACGGTTADVPAGVVMHMGSTTGTFGRSIVVADAGFVTVKSSGTFVATTTQSKWLRTAASGAVTPASSSADTASSPIVGMLAQAPATTTPSTVFMKIIGAA